MFYRSLRENNGFYVKLQRGGIIFHSTCASRNS
jgi:hypothetical protein